MRMTMQCGTCGDRWSQPLGEPTKQHVCPKAFDADAEAEWSHATALGEAVWLRMCGAQRKDPKDPALSRLHDQVVAFTRDAAFVLESDGFDGLATWLEAEAVIET